MLHFKCHVFNDIVSNAKIKSYSNENFITYNKKKRIFCFQGKFVWKDNQREVVWSAKYCSGFNILLEPNENNNLVTIKLNLKYLKYYLFPFKLNFKQRVTPKTWQV